MEQWWSSVAIPRRFLSTVCAGIALAVGPMALAQPGPGVTYSVTRLAGSDGGSAHVDGVGVAARFTSPYGVARDASGTVFVTDFESHVIRRVTAEGVVSTFAGLAGVPGAADGAGATARFNRPWGLAIDGAGNLYVADYFNYAIRKVTPTGIVTTLAGAPSRYGTTDGAGTEARFTSPAGVAVDSAGTVFVVEYSGVVRRVTAAGVVTTVAGAPWEAGWADGAGAAVRFKYPYGIALDGVGSIYVADTGNYVIRKVTSAGVATTIAGAAGVYGYVDGAAGVARFYGPRGIATDATGNLFVTDGGGVRRLSGVGEVTTFVGGQYIGYADGTGSGARFSNSGAIFVAPSGAIDVADTSNYAIRQVTVAGVVTTLAGLPAQGGYVDGTGTSARFGYPAGLAVTSTGDILVGDGTALRRVTPAGTTSVVAGALGLGGSQDGVGAAARFSGLYGVAIDAADTAVVVDSSANTIRRVTAGGSVTTLAGLAFTSGSSDGAGAAARFNYPRGVALDAAGNAYVADSSNHTIRKVTPAGVVTTVAGLAGSQGVADGLGSAARFSSPWGIAIDGAGTLYVADLANRRIRRVSADGNVTTLAGTGAYGSTDGPPGVATFAGPMNIEVDASGQLLVGDRGAIRWVTPEGHVTTIAGSAAQSGNVDGPGVSSRFGDVADVAVANAGVLYVADSGNYSIRKAVPGPLAYELSVIRSGAGDGAVASVSPGIACGSDCSENYAAGTAVSLNASASAGSAFLGWSGPCTGSGPCNLTMAGERIVGATFVAASSVQPLTVTRSGSGTGTVTSQPSGIDCGAACTVNFLTGTLVTLSAAVTVGNVFIGWSGEGCSGTGSCQVTMSAARNVTAEFQSVPTATLSVAKSGSGGGVVTSSPAGIACGSICSSSFSQGSLVTLTAVPDSTAAFLGFVGEGCAGGTVCQVTMSAARSVTAVFVITNNHAVTLLAGAPGGAGWVDGPGATARFSYPRKLAADGAGRLIVADTMNNVLRRVGLDGSVSTAVGVPGTCASADGVGASARTCRPVGIAVDATGTVFFGDLNLRLHRVSPAGVVAAIAGGAYGTADGAGAQAQFASIEGVAVGVDGHVYVADASGHTIRRMTPMGVLTTLAGLGGASGASDGTGATARFSTPSGLAVDAAGNVYVADSGNHAIRKVTAGGVVTTLTGTLGVPGSSDGTGASARFSSPQDVAIDAAGNLYVADSGNNRIRKVTPAGVVTTLAGLAQGFADGTGSAARFSNPTGLSLDSAGNVYVADYNNHSIRRISPAGLVTTLAGLPAEAGVTDGTGASARWKYPRGGALDAAGNLYVADTDNHAIRKVSPAGVVTTFAGLPGVAGAIDAHGTAARFNRPAAVTIDSATNLYVADQSNLTIRKISPAGTVTTLAGSAGQSGSSDGTGSAARFSGPAGVGVDNSGNVYVSDSSNLTIRRITPAGQVTTLAGQAGSSGPTDGIGAAARFYYPTSLAVDASGWAFVVDSGRIRRVTPSGAVTTLQGPTGSPTSLYDSSAAIAVDAAGILYIADYGRLLALSPAGGTTMVPLAGSSNDLGAIDGRGPAARFSRPGGLAVGADGTLIVVDTDNSAIRKAVPPVDVRWQLRAFPAGPGSIGSSPPGIECGTDCSEVYVAGVPITLTATPSASATFVGWGGNAGCAGTGACQMTSTAERIVAATFVPTSVPSHTLTVVVSGSGTVSSSPAGISCGALCSAPYLEGSGVTLTATPAAGFVFTGWTGGDVCGSLACQVLMLGPRSVSATFAPITSLTLAEGLDNTVQVFTSPSPSWTAQNTASAPGGGSDAARSAVIADNQSSSLQTSVTGLGTLRFWWRTSSRSGDQLRFLMDGAEVPGVAAISGLREWQLVEVWTGRDSTHTLEWLYAKDSFGAAYDDAGWVDVVSFTPAPPGSAFSLTIARTGVGTIGSSPTGINCGAACTAAFLADTVVTLTATVPSYQTRFLGWMGEGCSGTGSCQVTMNRARDVTAVFATSDNHTVTHFAGSVGGAGWADGVADARFNRPSGIAIDGNGNIIVADLYNCTIRKVTAAGAVSTLAGLVNRCGSADGAGAQAQFASPKGAALAPDDTIIVADMRAIRRVSPAGVTATLAGGANSGATDGTGAGATFSSLEGVAVDVNGNAYVVDSSSHTLRRVSSSGVVTTLAGTPWVRGFSDGVGPAVRFDTPSDVAVDASGNVYVADTGNHLIRRVTPGGVSTTFAGLAGAAGAIDGTGATARFSSPKGLAFGADGTLYVADHGNHLIRKVTPAGVVTTLAGLAGQSGSGDGLGAAARFNQPRDLVADGSGHVFVVEEGNHTVRRVSAAGLVATIAGRAAEAGEADGTGAEGRLNAPRGSVLDEAGNLYVADSGNHTIRRITPAGFMTTLAGSPGTPGGADGRGNAARFNLPFGITRDAGGNLYVADSGNHTIRRVTAAGEVTTVAGATGNAGGSDGIGGAASFRAPRGVAADATGNLFIADTDNHTIRRVTPAGEVTTLAGLMGVSGFTDGVGSAARFTYPESVAVDASGYAIVIDQRRVLRQVSPAGVVTPHPFSSLYGLRTSKATNVGILYAADEARLYLLPHTIGSGWLASLVGEYPAGAVDGRGRAASFANPGSIAAASDGKLFVTDTGNNSIRKVSPPTDIRYQLDVTVVGGSGSVTSSPAGIVCGTDCSQVYTSGSLVTLSPVPEPGGVFVGWSGDCSGTGPCVVNTSSYRRVGATFVPAGLPTPSLTISLAGAGSGTVTSAPAGIVCGATCTATFLQGQGVALMASPSSGSVFTGWSGACAGGGTCILTMTGATNVTATFKPLVSLTLAEGLDNQVLTFETTPPAWTAQTGWSSPGGGDDAARSGPASGNGTSTLQATLTGPGLLRFWWRVSATTGDYLRFRLDDTEVVSAVSGVTPWALVEVPVTSGSHTAAWTYAKGGSYGGGEDAGWVDQVSFVPGGAPTFADDPLTVRSTAVRAVHIVELRNAIGILRARYSLPGFPWTDAVLTPGATVIKAAHLTELRTALNAVYTAAGRTLPTWTPATVTAGQTTVTAAQIAEVRLAVLAIW